MTSLGYEIQSLTFHSSGHELMNNFLLFNEPSSFNPMVLSLAMGISQNKSKLLGTIYISNQFLHLNTGPIPLVSSSLSLS